MTTIAERAAAAAGRTDTPTGSAEDAPPAEDYTPTAAPMVDYEPGEDDPEMVPVHLAWLRVRKDVRAIAKAVIAACDGSTHGDGVSTRAAGQRFHLQDQRRRRRMLPVYR